MGCDANATATLALSQFGLKKHQKDSKNSQFCNFYVFMNLFNVRTTCILRDKFFNFSSLWQFTT